MQCIFVDFCSKLCIFVNSKCIILTVTAITAFTVILVEYYSAIVAALINIWHAYASVTYLFVLTKKKLFPVKFAKNHLAAIELTVYNATK